MIQDGLFISNRAEITGTIVSDFTFGHEIYGEGFYNFFIEVPRLSQVSDILPITISERLLDKPSLPMGTVVHIDGQIRSYNNYLENTRRNKLILTVFTRELQILEDDGAKMPNSVYLNGFICKPPVYRSTPFGREISDILLAVNRSYNKSDYIPLIAWGRNARFCGKLAVGDNMEIWGRMQSRKYQKKYDDGQVEEKTAFEISVSKIDYAVNPPQE